VGPHLQGREPNRIIPTLLDSFFELGKDGKFRQKRLTKEREMVEKRAASQSENAKKRWGSRSENEKKREPKTSNNNEIADATAMPSHLHTHTEEEKKKERERSLRSRGARLPADWHPTEADMTFGVAKVGTHRVALEIPKFKDYWQARAGPRAKDRDWIDLLGGRQGRKDQADLPKLGRRQGGSPGSGDADGMG
jgi:hypothetical protein